MLNNKKSKQDTIRTQPCPNCYLCGTPGNILYQGLKDRLFEVTGQWNFKVCPNPDCGLVWLDPMPLEEEIFKVYENYYTHQTTNTGRNKNSLFAGVLRWNIKLIVSILKRIMLINLERNRINLMYLHNTKPGRLLEVGCGAGHLLSRMHNLGWEVEGQEVDLRAAENARSLYGLPIHFGALQDLSFPDNTFDAIIMNHIIEHVYDPVAMFTECHRILHPNGVLIVTTPNIKSCGHQYFKSLWMGLDPPRHLYLFSPNTLLQAAVKAAFNKCRVWTTAARTQPIAVVSFEIKHNKSYRIESHPQMSSDIMAMLFQIWAQMIHIAKPNLGDECVLMAKK